MSKPILLDTFCKAGGCTKGYQDAGFEVVGIDIEPQPNYIGDDFIQTDAIEALWILVNGGCIVGQSGQKYYLDDFTVIHASPPCQTHSVLAPLCKKDYLDLIEPTRAALIASGKPYVIENVPGAPLINPITLCGTMFGGLRVIRHRKFETNPVIWWPPASCNHWGRATGAQSIKGNGTNSIKKHGFAFVTVVGNDYLADEGRAAMGIDWMIKSELSEAIPPAYTKWLGERLLEKLALRRSNKIFRNQLSDRQKTAGKDQL